jgi:hypothetical protein
MRKKDFSPGLIDRGNDNRYTYVALVYNIIFN